MHVYSIKQLGVFSVTLQQTVLTKGKISLPTFQQSKIGSSTLPSNGIILSTPDHTVEPVVSTSDDAKGIAVSTVSTTNIDIIKATFSSVKTSKYVTKNSKGNIMDNTTTPHSNSVQSKNLNTGKNIIYFDLFSYSLSLTPT